MSADALRRIARTTPNFRAVGEGVVPPGRLYRSSTLSDLDADGWAALADLGIRTLIDLRGPDEVAVMPVTPPDGITRISVTLSASGDARFDGAVDEASTAALIADVYRRIVQGQAEGIGRALARLAEPDALPAVIYCTAGKDRTGILCALLLLAVGAPLDLVHADYERTNTMLVGAARTRIWERSARVATFGMPEGPVVDAMIRADRAYLAAAIEGVGAIEDYLAARGIDAGVRAALREGLLGPDAGADTCPR